ncbi:hypothetical protein EIN_525840 [Entamoeba invadens IP1]|uniref:Uncharacterized protein n=1 Tax=Entamoeba invadens IP1 TaxID=370355 RepID=A0A0A1UBI2_ENTIV|nr:hypothetical protein EIN_525840 [Entamoeba invadens IP1]ELP89589.1 hypothetical protein EIN_525840 [Entamoeba invadens IP1]|eukprot:XP_004256360.1 hypothetical protein EIN_525840 [Entamoeba invadens IP1]
MFKKFTNLVKKDKDELSEQIEHDKKELDDLEKKIKKFQSSAEKLGDQFKTQFDDHKKCMKIGADCVNTSPNPFEQSVAIIEEASNLYTEYQEKLESKAFKPLKNFMESITTLQKRVKILDDRKKALDKAEEKYHDMLKKPESKQLGLSDLKTNYQNSLDSWTYLRDEMSVDIRKLVDDINGNFAQICGVFMKIYADYMRKADDVWKKLYDFADDLKVGDLDKQLNFTPTDHSMVGEPNVQARREKEISQGTYKKIE